jgi:DNA-binding HxlR family transcriptional regulator
MDGKSHCAINFTLEAIGDPWSLLIIRDIVFDGKHTFNEFLTSEEHIATNILSQRLSRLEKNGILISQPDPADGRKRFYNLTNKGLDLLPVLLQLAIWGAKHDPETAANMEFGRRYYENPEEVFNLVFDTVKSGGAVFAGKDSVVAKLGIGSL